MKMTERKSSMAGTYSLTPKEALEALYRLKALLASKA